MSNNYRVVVGDQSQVLKIEVGTPTRNVLISNAVNLNDVVGITTSNIQKGDILIADSDGILRNSQSSVNKIDGKVFNRDSDRGFILIRRSPDSGTPTGLYSGELAYSYLSDPSYGGGGNGGDRLYFGVGSDGNELAERIDVIGGKYFTDLLSHTHGVTTPSTALIVDSVRSLDQLTIDNLTINQVVTTDRLTADSASINTLSVDTINAADLATNLLNVIAAGEGVDLTLDSAGKIIIAIEFASFTNAGIASFDSDQFLIGDSGAIALIVQDAGEF
tara:strand:+ start:4919 stop:5743 length:825 start_codon:yes stop_codon:yes gene_type:complete